MAVDLQPHPLVPKLAQELATKGVITVTSAKAKATPDELAAALTGDAQLPEVIAFAGYLGAAVQRGGQPWRLLYLDWRLRGWLLVDESAIYLRIRVKDDAAPEGERDVIYVDARASVGRGTGPQADEARFLRGQFTSAGDISASLTGGTFSAPTGIFCEAVTPQCCGKPTRR